MSTLQRSLVLLLAGVFAIALSSSSVAQEDKKTDEQAVQASTDSAGAEGASQAPADGAHAAGEHADSEHADSGHADTDPTHANVSDATFAVVDFRTDMAFFSAIAFLLLLVGLAATAWKPIIQGLEKREHDIAANIARAEKAAAEATQKLAEYETKLAAAAEESQRILAEARKDAEVAGQKLVATAQEEAARQRDRAVADIESAKRVALSELADRSTAVAMALAQRVVGREVRAEDHQGLIQEMLAQLPSEN